ncbi:MAG: hypothetical protein JKX78_14065 [Alteromonadaceae bacterium]|nr:hypothetical protein [Alteromonadaceae bacterium]
MKILFIKIFLVFVINAVFFISINSFAQQEGKVQKTINISVVQNSFLVDKYKKIIVSAYNRLGYKVILHQTPMGRSLLLTNSSRLDAELIRLTAIEKKHPNLLRVPVKLADGRLELFCSTKVVCNESVLSDPTTTIGITNGSSISENFMINKKAKIYKINTQLNLGSMLKKERLNYILNITNKNQISLFGLDRNKYQTVPLMHIEAYHYVNKKYKSLIPKLAQALKKELKVIE